MTQLFPRLHSTAVLSDVSGTSSKIKFKCLNYILPNSTMFCVLSVFTMAFARKASNGHRSCGTGPGALIPSNVTEF